jgi:hypothetical protein
MTGKRVDPLMTLIGQKGCQSGAAKALNNPLALYKGFPKNQALRWFFSSSFFLI